MVEYRKIETEADLIELADSAWANGHVRIGSDLDGNTTGIVLLGGLTDLRIPITVGNWVVKGADGRLMVTHIDPSVSA